MHQETPATRVAGPCRMRSRLARMAGGSRVRWLPAGVAFGVCVALLLRYGVAPGELARYLLWILYGAVIPGTLMWRRLRGESRSFVEDVACGTAAGYGLLILVYIALRRAGAPMLILLWPALVIGVFAWRPNLRPLWRPVYPERVPVGWSWAVAVCVVLLAVWLAGVFFQTHPLSGPIAGRPYVDFPYHLAAAAEVKHHMPPQWSFVAGERMAHHWFPHAEAAASGWATGLELRLILLRLQILPFAALGVVITALFGSRLARRWWAGPVTVVIAYFLSSLSPYGWSESSAFFEPRLMAHFQWQSPTQLVATALFAPVLLLLTDRFRRRPGAAGQWLLITLLLAAAMGSKSTVLPLFIAGCGFAGLVELIMRRRIDPVALTGGVIGAALFVFSYVVLFGSDTYGLEVSPLAYVRRLAVIGAAGFDRDNLAPLAIGAITVMAIISWFARAAAAAGLIGERDPEPGGAKAFCVGTVIAGVALTLSSLHPGGSNVNFLRTAMPMLAALGAAGIAALVPRTRPSGPVLAALTAAAAAGGASTWAIMSRTPAAPSFAASGTAGVLQDLAEPFLILAAVVLATAVSITLLGRSVHFVRGIGVALVAALVAGSGIPGTAAAFAEATDPKPAEWFSLQTGVRPIPDTALAAARWLRDHSSPNDLVATNSHCRFVPSTGGCDNRHFWVAAYTERRVLVEGWGYTTRVMARGGGFYYGPYWDPGRLADNDRAFSDPSSASMARLRSVYGVEWLFVDERFDTPDPSLHEYARLRHRHGPFAVYRL